MKDYLVKLFLTLVIVVVGFGILVLLYNLFEVWGVVGGFVAFIGIGIAAYNYSNKKDKESCPLNKKE